jgi:hypothetical protein
VTSPPSTSEPARDGAVVRPTGPVSPRQRLVVVGGDAAGMSAAAQARRLRDAAELEITVLEQGTDVSSSACGIRVSKVGDLEIGRTRQG